MGRAAVWEELPAEERSTLPEGRLSGALWLSLVGVTGLGMWLRLGDLTAQPFWLDEYLWTQTASVDPVALFWEVDGYPPLYGLLVHALLGAGLGDDFWLRLPSTLAGVAAIPVVAVIGARAGTPRAGVLAALLLASNPLAIWYSIEAGAYSLLSLSGVLATWCLLEISRGGGRGWTFGYAAAAFVGLGLHYYFAFVLVVHAVFALTEIIRAPSEVRRWLLVALVTGLALSVWVPPLLADIGGQADEDAGRPFRWSALPYTAFTFVGGMSSGPSVRELHPLRDGTLGMAEVLGPHAVVIVLSVSSLLVTGVLAFRRRLDQTAWLTLALAVAPVLLAWAASAVLVGYRPRYALGALPFALLWVASVVEARDRRVGAALLGVLAATSWLGVRQLNEPTYQREDLRSIAHHTQDHPDAPVLLLGETAVVFRRYASAAQEQASVYFHPEDVETEAAIEAELGEAAFASEVWVVSSRPWTVDGEGRLEAYLAQRFEAVRSASFPGADVTLHRSRAGGRAEASVRDQEARPG